MARHGDPQHGLPRRRPPLQPPGPDLAGPGTDDLLSAAGRGDLHALARFYDRTAPAVFGMMRGVLGESESAARATERIYLKLWRRAPEFDPTGGSAYALLLHTARRELPGRVRDLIGRRPPRHDER